MKIFLSQNLTITEAPKRLVREIEGPADPPNPAYEVLSEWAAGRETSNRPCVTTGTRAMPSSLPVGSFGR
jgi:hypothetical protein